MCKSYLEVLIRAFEFCLCDIICYVTAPCTTSQLKRWIFLYRMNATYLDVAVLIQEPRVLLAC